MSQDKERPGAVGVMVRRGTSGIELFNVATVGDVIFILPYSRATSDGRVGCKTVYGWTAVDRSEAVRATKPVPREEALRLLAGLRLEDAATGAELPKKLVRRINYRRKPT